MTTKDEALSLALEALESVTFHSQGDVGYVECDFDKIGSAITAIKQAQDGALIDEGTKPQAITPETGNAATPEASAITAGNGQQAKEPVGINGLTEAETSASMSVMGLSKRAPKQAEPCQHCGATHTKGMNTLCDDGKPQAEPAIKESLAAQWQPIESAPKDGRAILLANPDGSCAVGWFKFRGHTTGWTDGDTFNMTWPTHWMKLPTPPGAKS